MPVPAALDLQFHGVRCRIVLQDDLLHDSLVSLYEHALGGHGLGSEDHPELTVTILRSERAPEPPLEPTFRLASGHDIWGDLTPDGLVLSDGRSTARVDYANGRASLELSSTDYAATYSAVHRHFPIALGELLRTRGVYYLHAAAVAGPNGAVIMAGDSEAGKTTLAYTAMRDGMKLLGDDGLVFARGSDGEAYVEPFYRELAIDETTLTSEDRAVATPGEPMSNGDARVRLVPHPSRFVARARVRAVLGITRAQATSVIAPALPTELISELARQNPFVALTPQLAGAHLGALGHLLRGARLGIVHSGPDIIRTPGVTRRLLEGWLDEGKARDGVPSPVREVRVGPS